jgi:hypothetical protein
MNTADAHMIKVVTAKKPRQMYETMSKLPLTYLLEMFAAAPECTFIALII